MFGIMAEQASEVAPSVDWLHDVLTWVSVVSTALVVGSMLYFAVKYRRRNGKDHETPRILGSHSLEVVLTTIPTILCAVVGVYGYLIFRDLRTVPDNALRINVWAQKWKWDFEYENGKKRTGEAVVPVDRPVQFILKSRDVLHSFFVPAMRVKSDAIPGQYTYVSFKPVKTGRYNIFCTEFCGLDHSQMLASVNVVSEAEYDRWVSDRSEELAMKAMSPAVLGEKLFKEKGCNACHSLNGTRLVGPSFLKLFGRDEKFTDGSSTKVDENYIQESIYEPNKKIVEGYVKDLMPNFSGQLDDDQIHALIAFIKAQDGSATAAVVAAPVAEVSLASMSAEERGKKWYQEKMCVGCHSLDGSKLVGPSFKGVWGRTETLVDKSTVKVDEAYVKRSVLEPMAQVVDGYAPSMPSFQGQLTDEQIADIIAFLKTAK